MADEQGWIRKEDVLYPESIVTELRAQVQQLTQQREHLLHRLVAQELRAVESMSVANKQKAVLGQFQQSHGRYKTPEYNSWNGIIQRCTNPKSQNWHRYGGRGIRVCSEWLDFETFLRDMGEKPGPGYSIDRIDNDGNYEPGNCRWVTHKENCANRGKRPGTSRFKGVSLVKASGKWRAQIGSGKNKKHIGTFETEELASAAYDAARGAK